jgi:hypothetical protein
MIDKVGEKMISTSKIRNNYGGIQLFIIQYVIAILDFSLLLLVKLLLLILFAYFFE